jgi:hypothetical protein
MIAAAILLAGAPQVPSVSLGFSGATLSVKSVDDPRRHGTAHRRLTLTLPSGKSRSIELKDGGGIAHNHALNLYHGEQDSFLLVGERDCVAVDPVKGALNQCRRASACEAAACYDQKRLVGLVVLAVGIVLYVATIRRVAGQSSGK